MPHKINHPICVASRSFSKNETLRKELSELFSTIKFNANGVSFNDNELIQFLDKTSGAIIALEKITDPILAALPTLKVISKYGVGLDNLDLKAMKERNVTLQWTAGVNKRSVAELALSFALGLSRNTLKTSRDLYNGVWNKDGGSDLTKKTVGIIGCGNVGTEFIKLLKPFECKILVHDILDKSDLCRENNYIQVDKKTVFTGADVVSLHVPYDPTTHHFVTAAEFGKMKQTAVLINTSRGNIVDEKALAEALTANKIKGAASDVFAVEPPDPDYDLLKLPNFFGTPHIGGSTNEAVLAMGRAAIRNLYSFYV